MMFAAKSGPGTQSCRISQQAEVEMGSRAASQTYSTQSLKVHLTSDFFIRLNECACFLDYICEKIFGFG